MEGKVSLKSSDDTIFHVDEAVAMQSETLKDLIQFTGDRGSQAALSVKKVSGDILAMVIRYCEYHIDAKKSDSTLSTEDVKKWDKELVAVDRDTLFKLILAADYLNIKDLFELTCTTVAESIAACKDPEEIRQKYDIENDFSPEEEEGIKTEQI